jgi:ABC-type Fe3+-siderophore transport system permease subunit
MSGWVNPQSHVFPAVRLVASLVAGVLLAGIGGLVLAEYTFQGDGIQWLAISGGVGLGAAMAWILNRVWSHDPPRWMIPVAAGLSMAGEALAVHLDSELHPWPLEGTVAVVLAGVASGYGVYSAHRLAEEKRAKES